jgi:hypothetical protein
VEQIRTAAAADVAAMAALAGIRREQYARYQPLFWRPAAGALDKHRAHLASLIADDKVITLVSEESGQLIRRAEQHCRWTDRPARAVRQNRCRPTQSRVRFLPHNRRWPGQKR